MPVSRIDLLNQSFSSAFRGYARAEVDRLLQDVADSIGRLSDEKLALTNRVAALESLLVEFQQREVALRDAIMAIKLMNDELKASAQREAQVILDTARAKAESLVNQGNMRLAAVMEEIAEAKKIKAQFDMKIRSVIEGHLRLLEFDRQEEARILQAAQKFVREVGGNRNG